MNPTTTDTDEAGTILRASVRASGFRKATFGGAPRRQPSTPWVRAVVRPVEIRGSRQIQFEYFDARQAFARNVTDAEPALRELLAIGFANVHIAMDGEEIEIRISKKGKVRIARRAGGSHITAGGHNRAKELPLPEGVADTLLTTMGIATADGRVRPTMRPKFIQINECLKLLDHALEPAGLLEAKQPLRILDCGCGSSHLTLAVHHYLNAIRRIPATILGVDVNDAVIRKSLAKADALRAGGVAFACGTIGALEVPADIVLALHACDTATDDALAQAVRGDAKLILSAPCCHKHLNRQLQAGGLHESLRPILRHGILHERTADIVTDAFRALALRIVGYRADVIEFVSHEHTARNVMIRAVRTGRAGEPQAVREFREMKRFWNVTPYIETALGEPFRARLGSGEPG